MRPLRSYAHRYVRPAQTGDLAGTPTELTIVASGRSPCLARAQAFRLLEVQIRMAQLPAAGWRLVNQQRLPLHGSTVTI